MLADDFPDPVLRITRVPGAGGRAEFLPGVRVPIVPFCGEVGVAPIDGPRSTIPPDLHGGNMDTRHLTPGSTLFLPVFHADGRLSMGDGHAAQGDGEVCGTAIETPMRALVRLTVRKDLHVTAPEFLTADIPATAGGRRYATDGIGPDLLGAARDAVRRMIDWLGRGGFIPRQLGEVHPTYRTPVNAVHVQAVFGIILAVGLSLWLGAAYPATPGPENTYFFLGYALGLLFAGMYMAVNAAVIGYYLTARRSEFNVLRHAVVPILGFILMIPAFVSTLGGIYIPIADFTPASLADPYSLVPPLVLAWMVVGVVVGIVVRQRDAAKLGGLGEAVAEG